MKEGIEKLTYKNEVKNLCASPRDRRKNSNYSNGSGSKSNNYYKGSGSNASDHFSWRKGSSGSGSGRKGGYDNKGYYKNKKGSYKRTRFNSDPDNRYKNPSSFDEDEMEIDISSLKYPLNIRFKYSFKDVKSYLENLKKNDFLKEQPKFLSEGIDEIVIKDADKHKEILVLDSLIEEFEKVGPKEYKVVEENEINPDFENNKIPKMNPLSSLPKMFNKFDMVAGNIPQWNTFVLNNNKPNEK
jgi:hypothetical protein